MHPIAPDHAAAVQAKPVIDQFRALRAGLVVIRLGPVLMLVILVARRERRFRRCSSPPRNVGNVLTQTAVIAVLAIGQLLVILTRGIDLSVGSTLALSSVVGALVFESVSNGLVIVAHARHRDSPSASSTASSTSRVACRTRSSSPSPRSASPGAWPCGSRAASRSGACHRSSMPSAAGRSAGSRCRRSWSSGSRWSSGSDSPGLVWGRWIYAVGGNPEGARRAGIPVDAVPSPSTSCAGCWPASRAVITSGRLNGGSPTFGELAELDSIAAVVIGGASFLGGRGTVVQRSRRSLR